MIKQPLSKPRSVASFGASTAQGVGDAEKGGFIERLGELLEVPSLNFGVGGNTTRDMLARLPDLEIPDSCLVVISLGINDVARTTESDNPKRVPLDEHRAHVASIIETLKPRASLVYMTQFPVDYGARNLDAAYTESFVHAGLDAAREADVPHVVLKPHLDKMTSWQDLLAEDGLHFNGAGHAFMADLLSDLFASC